MFIGRVSGTVVATFKADVLQERKLLIVDRLGLDGQPLDGYVIAVDTVQAGEGDIVLIIDEGNSARQVVGWEDAPIRAVVVGIVDEVELWA